jgi:hypothetical protein
MGIFISYRRSDSALYAQKIFNTLARRFGTENIFLDVDTINSGAKWQQVLEEYLRKSDAVLVVIGPDWLSAIDATGRERLKDENDLVRLEIATALKKRIPIIPILIDTAMPSSDMLPDDIRAFSNFQAEKISPDEIESGIENIKDSLVLLLGDSVVDKVSVTLASAIGLTAGVLAFIIGLPSAFIINGFVHGMFPAVSGVTENTNDGHVSIIPIYSNLPLVGLCLSLLLLAFIALFVGAHIAERRWRNLNSTIIYSSLCATIGGFSTLNFINFDTLISVKAQFVLDIICVLLSIYLARVFVKMDAKSIMLRAAKALLVGTLLSLIVVPGYFAIMFALIKASLIGSHHLDISYYFGWVMGIVGVTSTIMSYRRTTRLSTDAVGDVRF